MSYDAKNYRSNAGMSIPADKIRAWIKKNFDYKERKGGDEIIICNPFSGDTKYKFNINPANGKCHCWTGNEWAGPINPETNKRNCSFVNFVKLYKNIAYGAAISDILGTSVDIRSYLKPQNRITDFESQEKVAVAIPDGVEPLATSESMQAKVLLKWLSTRGYTVDDVNKYDLQYLGMDVYWPYYEFDVLVYWQSRSRLNKKFNFPSLDICDKSGKIVGKTDGTKGDFLYGFDDVELASYIIITEAIFDKHTLGQQAMASGGAILTNNQIGKIKIIGPKDGVILSPDNDEAGIKSIIANYQLLKSHGFNIYYSLPPSIEYTTDGIIRHTKDWNEIGQYVSGFSKVRSIHDDNIKKLDESGVFELVNMIEIK